MGEAERARQYLSEGRYKEAMSLLDLMLSKEKGNDELWYLRGVVSLKLKSYDAAMEYFERALSIRQRAEYHRIRGMAQLEVFEIDEAIESFDAALGLDPKDPTSRFFLAVCFMMMDDPRAADHLKSAIAADPKRTRQLLMNFYTMMFDKDRTVSESDKKRMQDKIRSI